MSRLRFIYSAKLATMFTLATGIQDAGMSGLARKWVRLAPNGTNLGFFKIRFVPFGTNLTQFLGRLLHRCMRVLKVKWIKQLLIDLLRYNLLIRHFLFHSHFHCLKKLPWSLMNFKNECSSSFGVFMFVLCFYWKRRILLSFD